MGAAAIVAVATAAMAVYQGYQQSAALQESAKMQERAGQEAQRVADENASRVEAEGAEQQRRMDLKQKQEEATARAQAAASGAVYTPEDEENDSISNVLTAQKEENKRQLDWEKLATKSQADSMRKQGAYENTMARYQAKSLKSQAKSAVQGGWISGITAGVSGMAGASTGAEAGQPATYGEKWTQDASDWWAGSSFGGGGAGPSTRGGARRAS